MFLPTKTLRVPNREGEVLIGVQSTGVNPVDLKTREGYLRSKRESPMPLILGWDVSGVVEESGSSVAEMKVGEAVYALGL